MQATIENDKPEFAILRMEKKELRLQRKLYTLLLVMMIAFGGLAVVMFKMILAFQVDMDGMRDNMDRMTPAIVMMSSTMSGLADHISTMTADVSRMRSGMDGWCRSPSKWFTSRGWTSQRAGPRPATSTGRTWPRSWSTKRTFTA